VILWGGGELESRGFGRRKRGTSAQIVGTPLVNGAAQIAQTPNTYSVNTIGEITRQMRRSSWKLEPARWPRPSTRCPCRGIDGIDGLSSGFSSVRRKGNSGGGVGSNVGVCVFSIGETRSTDELAWVWDPRNPAGAGS
jgi:hypothetical protein